MAIFGWMTSFILVAVTMISTFNASVVVASAIWTVGVCSAFNTLTIFTCIAVGTVIVRLTVNTHILTTAGLTIATVTAAVATKANVLVADAVVVAVTVVGTFNTLFVVTHAIAVIIRVAIIRLHLVAARACSN